MKLFRCLGRDGPSSGRPGAMHRVPIASSKKDDCGVIKGNDNHDGINGPPRVVTGCDKKNSGGIRAGREVPSKETSAKVVSPAKHHIFVSKVVWQSCV